jgi:murein DD-endopeptidase MepM/ murein hydrolase activator NlpD
MKKLYYFSKKKLQFVEIQNYKRKLLVYFSIAVFSISGLFFGLYAILNTVLNSEKNFAELRKENQLLKSKLGEYSALFTSLNNELDSITSINNYLRLAANLRPLSDDERKIGTGGGFFDNLLDFSPSGSEFFELESFLEEIKTKIDFEKSEYKVISSKLEENNRLFDAIPAIRPCLGDFGTEGFGMRRHPILKIVRMHEGVDIITNTGTSVFASGRGKVDFVGRRGGYGLTVEINHGFGYRTVYAHLSKTLVKSGQTIDRGHLIALSGNSGLSTGPHLHYEVHHNGIKKDPEEFFFGNTGFFEFTKNKK